METLIYKTRKRELSFDEKGFTITDDIKSQKLLMFFNASLSAAFGVTSILRYTKTGDQFLLWSGLFIGIGSLISFVIILFRSTKMNIGKDEIKSIRFKKRFGNDFMAIRLNGNKIRTVNLTNGFNDELKEYINANFIKI